MMVRGLKIWQEHFKGEKPFILSKPNSQAASLSENPLALLKKYTKIHKLDSNQSFMACYILKYCLA